MHRCNRADAVDDFAGGVLVERGASISPSAAPLQAQVVMLDGDLGVVHDLADGREFRIGLNLRPAGGPVSGEGLKVLPGGAAASAQHRHPVFVMELQHGLRP